MYDPQADIFRWVTNQPLPTSLTLCAAGLVVGLQGWRFIAPIAVLSSVALGYFAMQSCGRLLPEGVTAEHAGLGAAAFLGAVALWKRTPAFSLVCGAILGGAVTFFLLKLGFKGMWAVVPGLIALPIGIVLGMLSTQPMTTLVTSLLGASLFFVSAVGVIMHVQPDLGTTLLAACTSNGTLSPVIALMLTVTAYNFQASFRKGTLVTGSETKIRREAQGGKPTAKIAR
jgi:hypothetical protein